MSRGKYRIVKNYVKADHLAASENLIIYAELEID